MNGKKCVIFCDDISIFVKSIKPIVNSYDIQNISFVVEKAFIEKGYFFDHNGISHNKEKYKNWQCNFYPWIREILCILKGNSNQKQAQQILEKIVGIICHQHRRSSTLNIQFKRRKPRHFRKTPTKLF